MKRQISTLRLQKETLRSLTGVDLAPMESGIPTRKSCTQICPLGLR